MDLLTENMKKELKDKFKALDMNDEHFLENVQAIIDQSISENANKIGSSVQQKTVDEALQEEKDGFDELEQLMKDGILEDIENQELKDALEEQATYKIIDEKAERENNLAKKEAEVQELLDNAKANAENIKELENKVNNIPKLLEGEYTRGKKETTAELDKEHKYAVELLKKDFQNTIDRQNDKIESLQEEVRKFNLEKESLQNKLDQAYIQIKEMATKTVEATGGVKILGNSGNETNK